MKHGGKILSVFVFITLFALMSCATTTLTSVWRDPAYQGEQIRKVLVIGVSDKPAIKRLFEDEFVRQLQAKGVEGISSYTILPSEGPQDKDIIQAKVKELNIDGIIITRLIDKKRVETYYPPERISSPPPPLPPPYPSDDNTTDYYYYPPVYYYDWYRYYHDCYDCISTPGYKVEDEIVVLETNLYNAKNDKLIWSALSDTFIDTFDRGLDRKLIKSFISVILKKLSDDMIL
ncbi:MAG: hypothetical protein HXY53_02465 [Nitrospirae bacterium]|nr:hypothetical protein [Nitrospirota bacterium]